MATQFGPLLFCIAAQTREKGAKILTPSFHENVSEAPTTIGHFFGT